MTPNKKLLLFAGFLASCFSLCAQVNFPGTYTQNFDALGTGNTMPIGWSHIGSLGGSNSTWGSSIPASGSISAASTGTTNDNLIVATNTFSGTSNTRAYNYSGSTTTNRALGTSPTSGAGNILQLRLLNNSGSTFSTVQISYDILRFATSSASESLPGYFLFASVNNGSTWTALTALNPTSTTVPNTNGTSNFSQQVTLSAAIANGAELRLRWVDDNSASASPDQRIGLDNISISVVNPGVCGIPTGLLASTLAPTSAALNWQSVLGATAYNVQWRALGGATFNVINNVTGTSTNITGLTEGTGYEFQVQAVCGTATSAFSALTSFTTPVTGVCGVPTGLSAGSITSSSALLSWTTVSGASAYNLQWKTSAATVFTTVSNLTTNSFTLSGLTASTAHEFQVQAVCNGTTSAYSALANFTTGTNTTVNEVIHLLSGALQATSVTISAKMTSASSTCRAVVSANLDLSNPIYSAFVSSSSATNFMTKFNVTGLQPNTQYYYAIESNGVLDNSSEDIGQFKTPASGAFSFSFAHGSCSGSVNHQVYAAIQNKNPLFFIETGDFHYADPNSSNIATHRNPYETILSASPTSSLLKRTALAYMWDDHDYCGNNNTGSGLTGTANARQAYQEYIPHYPLVAGSGNVPIYQSFVIGRVRFILADLRSLRSSGTMFGTTQKEWFKQQCLAARDNCQMIAWITGTSWGGTQSDNWGGFSAERTELSNFFRDNNILNMMMFSGDAHMIAIDNGSNHDFSTGSNNPNDYPVFAAAGLNQSGSNKGGTYSQGAFTNPSSTNGQYGIVEVTDNGGSSITFTFRGYRTTGNSTTETQIVTYSFTRNFCTPAAGMPMNNRFALRSAEEGAKVNLNWDISSTSEQVILERAGKNGEYTPIAENLRSNGSITDEHPRSGWNLYRLVDATDGSTIASQEVFVTGKSELKAFPNPSVDHVNLSLSECDDIQEGYLLVFDAMAKCVKEELVPFSAGNNAKIDISDLEPGLYTLLLQAHGASMTQTILVSK